MANVLYVGQQRTRAYVGNIGIGTPSVGQILTVTYGGVWSISYTAITGDGAANVASSITSLMQAADGGFQESAYAVSGNASTVTVTGPDGGWPVTLALSGNMTSSLSNITTPLSPNDTGDSVNYSIGTLPSNGDRIIFEPGNPGPQFNVAALTGLSLTFDVRAGASPIGLPDQNPIGFREWRETHLRANSTSFIIAEDGSEQPGQFRFNGTCTTAATIVHTGTGQLSAVGSEPYELKGLPSNSTISINGGRLSLAPLTGQTGGAASVTVLNGGTFRAGFGSTLSTVIVNGSNIEIRANCPTLTTDGQAACVTLRNAAAVNALAIQGGTVSWASTGSPGNVTIGGGGTFDVSPAPAVVTLGVGNVTMEAGATLNDPLNRLGRPFNIQLLNCTINEVTITTGTSANVTVAA